MPVFHTELWLPRRPEEIFPFFADVQNLQVLTPPWLHFQVLTPPPVDMGASTRIEYRLRVHGLPVRWQSEITVWEPARRFVDEQRRGPYRRWRHEHTFTPRDAGTVAGDVVEYAVPGGVLMDRLLVARDLRTIFAYRHQQLRARFGMPA